MLVIPVMPVEKQWHFQLLFLCLFLAQAVWTQSPCSEGTPRQIQLTGSFFMCCEVSLPSFRVQTKFQSTQNDSYHFEIAYGKTCDVDTMNIAWKSFLYAGDLPYTVDQTVSSSFDSNYTAAWGFQNDNLYRKATIQQWYAYVKDMKSSLVLYAIKS